jgi:hypothetical protein
MNKGLSIELLPLDDDHVRARLHWREQDVGGGDLTLDVTVRNAKSDPKSEAQLQSDARALGARFARAFADTLESWG